MSTEQRPECSQEHWCPAMNRVLNNQANAHQKGLTIIEIANRRTGEEYIGGVAYKTKPNDPGLMLNVCPWCLAPILWIKGNKTFEAAARNEVSTAAATDKDAQ